MLDIMSEHQGKFDPYMPSTIKRFACDANLFAVVIFRGLRALRWLTAQVMSNVNVTFRCVCSITKTYVLISSVLDCQITLNVC